MAFQLKVYLPKVCPGTVFLRMVWQMVDLPTGAMLGGSSRVIGLRRGEHGLRLLQDSFLLRDHHLRRLGRRPLHAPHGLSNSQKVDKN